MKRLYTLLLFSVGLGLAAASLTGCDRACRVQGDSSVLVGGPFELTDHTGKTVTGDDFAGRYQFIYFGFTFCPDICPTELQVMSDALDMLGDDAAAFQPILITIDPERDDVAAMAAYVSHFHPSFVGLTGTPEQIAAAAGEFRVFYAKEPSPDAPDDYLMNHSSFVYLMDCQGRYIRHFSMGTTAEEMAAGLKALL